MSTLKTLLKTIMRGKMKQAQGGQQSLPPGLLIDLWPEQSRNSVRVFVFLFVKELQK